MNIWKKERLLVSKKRKCGEFAKAYFSKIAQTADDQARSIEAAFSEHLIAIHSVSVAAYITAVPAFVCGELLFESFLKHLVS